MQSILKYLALALFALLLNACFQQQENSSNEKAVADQSQTSPDASSDRDSKATDPLLAISDEPCYGDLLLDADGNINYSARTILHKNENLMFYYQRVGCNSDTCRQEIVTYAAIQYPKDSVLQCWLSQLLASFYADASRQSDILVNGANIVDNGEGDMEVVNKGCRPYEGILNDGGKSMFAYYQARMWTIGRDRESAHGPAGRYGCMAYRCWQSRRVASYMVAYSTSDVNTVLHQVVSFDRRTGKQLELTDVVSEDGIAELYDLLAEEAQSRHYQLLRRNANDLAIEPGACDYEGQLEITAVGLTQHGLAVSTTQLAFDQWANATHVLVIPYERLAGILTGEFVK